MGLHRLASVFTAGILVSCSLLTDFDGFTGGGRELDGGTGAGDGGVPTSNGGEDCTNGIDDDHDGLADCADPKCAAIGYACRTVPEGWQGPYAVFSGTAASPCVPPYGASAFESHDGLDAGAATCDCSCGSLTGETCYANVFYWTANCAALARISSNVPMSCTNLGPPPGVAVNSLGVGGKPGSCDLNVAPQPSVSWARTLQACRPEKDFSAAGCSATARCAPRAPSGFTPGSCISHDGDQVCPLDYPTKSIVYLGLSDDRKCDGCSCQVPACPSKFAVFDHADCSGTSATLTTACTTINAYSARVGDGTPRKCTVKPGTASGKATPTQPTTVCCTG